MKFTFEDKVQIYNERKCGFTIPQLHFKWNITQSEIEYIVRLVDRHGIDILRHIHHDYSAEFKEEAIYRVLTLHESILSVSIALGLSTNSILRRWIKEYKENGYNVVIRKRGRHAKEENNRGVRERNQVPTRAELEAINRERIHKKIRCLSYGKRKERKEEIVRAISELRQELQVPVRFIIQTINDSIRLPYHISRSDYYYWKDKQDNDFKYDDVMNDIIIIYYTHKGRYGYRRIYLEIRKLYPTINHKTVQRLMHKMSLFGNTPKAKYKSYKGNMNGTVKNHLLDVVIDEENHNTYYKRNFSTNTVNEKWTTDVSEFHITAGKLYLSPILDMHNREIISWNISKTPNYEQISNMLTIAFQKHPNIEGLIFHSDQGWQYQMNQYHKTLYEHGIIQSMSRKGNCLDNCVMENFFGKMKNEMFYGHEYEFKTLDELESTMNEYIHYYNEERIQTKLKGLTPCQARNQALSCL